MIATLVKELTVAPSSVRITVDLDPALHRRLKLAALEEGASVSDVIRSLVALMTEDSRTRELVVDRLARHT